MRPVVGARSRSGRPAGWLYAVAIVVAVRLPYLSRQPLAAVDIVLFVVVIAAVTLLEVARRGRVRADRREQSPAIDHNASVSLASRRDSRSIPAAAAHRRSA